MNNRSITPKAPAVSAKDKNRIAREIADAMLACHDEVMGKREEIMEAFVAKHGFEPDECEQVEVKNPDGTRSWTVVKLDPATTDRIRGEVLRARFGHLEMTRWNKFCLWLAEVWT